MRHLRTVFSKLRQSAVFAAPLLCTASALAAEVTPGAHRAPTTVVAPNHYWTGLYVGGNAGWAWGDNSDGFTGGGQIGYNWQTGNFVFGIEGDFQGADISATGTAIGTGLLISETVSADWFATIRGRIGYAFDRVLIYATGGGAFTEVKHNGVGLVGVVGTYSTSNSLTGWIIGGGIEWALPWDRWSAKIEYLHSEFGKHSNIYFTTVPAIVLNYSSFEMDHVRLGLNYRF